MNRADPAAPIRTQMGSAEWATLIGLSVLWGGSFFFIEVAVRSIPPFTLVLMRVSLAAAALLLFLRMRGSPSRIQGSVYLAFAIMGLLNNAVPFSLLAWGQTQIGGGLASIMNATTPIWGVIVAHLFTSDERITPLKLAGVLAGFAGVATMIGPELLAGIGKDLLAQCACLAAGLCYAAAGVYGRRFRRLGIDPVQVSAGQLAAAALILLPVALLLDQPWRIAPPPIEAWGSLLALALLSTTFALRALLPANRQSGRDQRAAGDLSRPGHCDPAGRAAARRSAGAAASGRHGADRHRPGRDRWPPVQPPAGEDAASLISSAARSPSQSSIPVIRQTSRPLAS
jgi:drug/metabolite transporter (DMT)-like permease